MCQKFVLLTFYFLCIVNSFDLNCLLIFYIFAHSEQHIREINFVLRSSVIVLSTKLRELLYMYTFVVTFFINLIKTKYEVCLHYGIILIE